MRFPASLAHKKLIVFDLDGTITPSKSNMTPGMARLVARLLAKKKVAMIGGGKYEQFKTQFIARMRAPRTLLAGLFLFPTTSTSFYRFRGGKWRNVYREKFTKQEVTKILHAFTRVFQEEHYRHPAQVYGKVLEDRGTQVTFSALGQDVVARRGRAGIAAKEAWNKKYNRIRLRMRRRLKKYLPKFSVAVGGLTSIDVTRKGIDKAYGVRQIQKHLGIPIRDMLFVGDGIFPGGNDYAVVRTGVDNIRVKGPHETAAVIRTILAQDKSGKSVNKKRKTRVSQARKRAVKKH